VVFLNEITISTLPEEFYLLTPIYTNTEQAKSIQPIIYSVSKTEKKNFLDQLPLGHYLCSFEPLEEDTICAINIYEEYLIIELINKQSEGYIGYLEELLNVPFVLPPRRLKEKHQTNLRLGVDCAEMAIYGRRRQGYTIPYCGPRHLMEYLISTDKVEAGTIISFGNNYQISVIYEDRGKRGILDDEDLLIHAYKDKAEINSLGESGLNKYPFRLYQWKNIIAK